MIHRFSNEHVEAYRDIDAVSQSQLKLLLAGVEAFNNVQAEEKYYSEKEHFIIGSGVDCYLTQGEQEYNNLYYISSLENKPTSTIMSIIKEAYDLFMQETIEISDIESEQVKSFIMQAINNQEYQVKWKDETRLSKVIEFGRDYWQDLIECGDRQILSLQQHDHILLIAQNILSHPYTEQYFKDGENVDIYFQQAILFEYKGVKCKALLDMVIIDHFNKTIQGIDIKTMGDYISNFPISFNRRRYDFQAAFYTEALNYQKQNSKADYKILPFKFIVESTINPKTPVVFTCSESILFKGKYGIPEERIGNHVFRRKYGFDDAIKLYKWHLENGFDDDKVIVENEGNLLLDLEGIVQ